MSNIFLKPAEEYKRQINPIQDYINQSAFYLSKMTGRDLSTCKDYVLSNIKNKETNQAIDPIVNYYERDHNGDKEKTSSTLSQYINAVVKNEEILAPTFTSYLNSTQGTSLLVDFIDNNKSKRTKAKKEAFRAEAAGDKQLFILKDNEQANMKLYNNSMSGAFGNKGSVLCNPTAHSTLTSIIRTVSSLGNASNEKIISGNRHYYNADIVLANLISITSAIDRTSLIDVITKYGLVYPSVDDVVNCIRYSSDLYWTDERAFVKIREFIQSLDEVERAGFVYIGDLYHIRQFNNDVIRMMLGLLTRKDETTQIEEPIATIYKHDEQIVNFAHHICMKEVRGRGKDYEKMPANDLNTLAATVVNIAKVIESYKDFITAMFLTDNIPASTAYIPNMIRRNVVLSDTDSTMFAVDEFVQWYFGELIFNDEAWGLAAGVMFIATQCIAHNLAIFSANINVEKSKLFNLAMKPEFSFPVFAQTSVAKHYFTCVLVREGNVFEKTKAEIKGVHLKNSAAPKQLIKDAHLVMDSILAKVMDNKKISIVDELKNIANVERTITESVLSGKVKFFKHSKIKEMEAYLRSAEQSPYLHHMFWEEVFASKYGSVGVPPYGVIKIPTIVLNITGVKAWLDSIEDEDIKRKLGEWLAKHKKTSFPTIYLSDNHVQSFGVPEEIKPVMNIRKIVLDLTNVNRMTLEALGFFPKPEILMGRQ